MMEAPISGPVVWVVGVDGVAGAEAASAAAARGRKQAAAVAAAAAAMIKGGRRRGRVVVVMRLLVVMVGLGVVVVKKGGGRGRDAVQNPEEEGCARELSLFFVRRAPQTRGGLGQW
jgi:hypothetical protein